MKKTFAIILILFLAPALIQANSTNSQVSEEELMYNILNELEGDYVRGDISANQMLYDKYIGLEILEGIGDSIKEELQIVEVDRLMQKDKNYSQINYYGYDKDNNQVTIILSSYYNEEIKNGGTFLYINFLNSEQFLSINGIIENVESLYKKYNAEADITTNIVGSIDRNIDLGDYQEIVKKTIEENNGKIIGRYDNENLISYNAYIDSIKNYIQLGEDKINLNIAVRCNKIEDKTIIYIGTPIIAGGY